MVRTTKHGLQGQVKPEHVPTTIEGDDGTKSCKWCGSASIVKSSIRKTKKGDVQRYRCRDCNRKFSGVPGFRYRRHSEVLITRAINMAYSGMSLRDIADAFGQEGIDVAHTTIYYWIERYGNLAKRYIKTVQPDASEVWRTDEIYIKLKGVPRWYYTMIDHKTRYCMADQMGVKKYQDDVRPMFKDARDRCGFIPARLISDGAHNFHMCWRKMWRQRNPLHKETEHIAHIHMEGDRNNNRMERFNGTIRDREVSYRGLKKGDGVLAGFLVHYNHVKRHGGVGGSTPGEAAGIHIPDRNKWMVIIQNASKHYHTKSRQG